MNNQKIDETKHQSYKDSLVFWLEAWGDPDRSVPDFLNRVKDDPYELFAAGMCCRTGYGVDDDEPRAAAFFRRAAELGNAHAAYALAHPEDVWKLKPRFLSRSLFRQGENKAPGGNPRYADTKNSNTAARCLTSIFYRERGPFTIEELKERAQQRLFNWDMYVLRIGDTVWRRVWEVPCLAELMDNNFHLGPGDPGPGGGLVFYDKGDYSDAWRYLEAAPGDIGMAPWGKAPGIETGRDLGDGAENTRRIVRAMEQAGVGGTAAQLCAAYSCGGLKDWFLPSSEELRVLAANLTFIKTGTWASDTIAQHWTSTGGPGGTSSEASSGNGENADVVFTWEKLDTWDPFYRRPVSRNGPRVGTIRTAPVEEALPVRPVRRF
jgi:hypothetical protein